MRENILVQKRQTSILRHIYYIRSHGAFEHCDWLITDTVHLRLQKHGQLHVFFQPYQLTQKSSMMCALFRDCGDILYKKSGKSTSVKQIG